MAFHKLSSLDELWSGEMMAVSIDGRNVLLVNTNDVVRAYVDACPHMRTRLSQGLLQDHVLTCATHQWQFDVRTGRGINPEIASLEEFPVRIENGEILVDLDVPEVRAKWCGDE